MLGWFRRFTHPLGQLDPYYARKRLRPVLVRTCAPTDLDRCRELYRLNEQGRFPPGVLPEFEQILQDGSHLFLVIEDDGIIVGCGGIGIQRWGTLGRVSLVFGLIHPQSHRRGLGSALLLARLALLPAQMMIICLQAVPSSRSFYEMFGFLPYATIKYDDGPEGIGWYAFLSPDDRKLCDTLLRRAGVTLPPDGLVVPVVDFQGAAPESPSGT